MGLEGELLYGRRPGSPHHDSHELRPTGSRQPSIPRWFALRKFFVEPHKDGGWVFWAHGMIAADLRLDKPGNYVITVTARGVPCENVDPVLNVYLDHCRANSMAISSKEFKDYEFRVADVPAGVNRLVLSYWNAASGGRTQRVCQGDPHRQAVTIPFGRLS